MSPKLDAAARKTTKMQTCGLPAIIAILSSRLKDAVGKDEGGNAVVAPGDFGKDCSATARLCLLLSVCDRLARPGELPRWFFMARA